MNWREMTPAQRKAAGIAATPSELRGDYSGGHINNNDVMRAAIARDAAAADSDSERTASEAMRVCLQALSSPVPNLEREFDRHVTHYRPARGADAKVNAEYAAQHRGGSSRPPASRPRPTGRPLPPIRYGADSVVRRCNRIEAMYRERYDNKKASFSNE